MEKYFFEAFEGLERLGPGSDSSTLKAASLINNNKSIRILDIGCGKGKHTLLLAKKFPNAVITAIDNNESYIKELNKNIKIKGLSNRVIGKCISMFEMPFEEGSFDLIWAEGSIYIAGFEKGICDWKKYLKPKGYLVCSEISWITETPSQESLKFWNEGYPQINTINNKIKQIEKAGYTFESEFILPKSDWLDNFYMPLQGRLNVMKKEYKSNEEAQEVIEMIQSEIDLYYKHSDDYSYVFYVMKN